MLANIHHNIYRVGSSALGFRLKTSVTSTELKTSVRKLKGLGAEGAI